MRDLVQFPISLFSALVQNCILCGRGTQNLCNRGRPKLQFVLTDAMSRHRSVRTILPRQSNFLRRLDRNRHHRRVPPPFLLLSYAQPDPPRPSSRMGIRKLSTNKPVDVDGAAAPMDDATEQLIVFTFQVCQECTLFYIRARFFMRERKSLFTSRYLFVKSCARPQQERRT